MEIEYEQPRVKYDPYEILKPSKAFLKEVLKELKQQAYDKLLAKQELKRQNQATQALCFPTLDREHQRLLKRIRDISFRLKSPDGQGGRNPGYITEVDRDRAKQVPIEQLYTGELRKTAGRLLGKCPFHQDDRASFVIYVDQNSWFCYSCSMGGDCIAYVMKQQNLNFIQAVRYLNKY